MRIFVKGSLPVFVISFYRIEKMVVNFYRIYINHVVLGGYCEKREKKNTVTTAAPTPSAENRKIRFILMFWKRTIFCGFTYLWVIYSLNFWINNNKF